MARTGSAVDLLRCLSERWFALLAYRWRTLQHITTSLRRIGSSGMMTFFLRTGRGLTLDVWRAGTHVSD